MLKRDVKIVAHYIIDDKNKVTDRDKAIEILRDELESYFADLEGYRGIKISIEDTEYLN